MHRNDLLEIYPTLFHMASAGSLADHPDTRTPDHATNRDPVSRHLRRDSAHAATPTVSRCASPDTGKDHRP